MAKGLSSRSQYRKRGILLKVFVSHMGSYLNVCMSSGLENCGLELCLWTSIAGATSHSDNVSVMPEVLPSAHPKQDTRAVC